MAIVKQDMCNYGKPGAMLEWKRPNWYVSEPMMIPSNTSKNEYDVIVVFVALNGMENKTYYITLDAKTMEPLERFNIRHRVPSTLHGS